MTCILLVHSRGTNSVEGCFKLQALLAQVAMRAFLARAVHTVEVLCVRVRWLRKIGIQRVLELQTAYNSKQTNTLS